MNTLLRDRRARRKAKFSLEHLDDRIVPSAMQAAAGAGAEAMAVVAASQRGTHAAEIAVLRHEHHLTMLAARHARHGHHHHHAHHVHRMASSASAAMTVAPGAAAVTDSVNVSAVADPPAPATGPAASQPSSGAVPSLATPPATALPVVTTLPLNPKPASLGPANPIGPSPTIPTQPSNPAPSTPVSPVPLPPNVSAPLQLLYQEFESAGGGEFTPTGLPPNLVIRGTDVGVTIHATTTGGFGAFVSDLQGDGLQVTASDATTQTVTGLLPIANLPAVAQLPQAPSVTPMFKPALM